MRKGPWDECGVCKRLAATGEKRPPDIYEIHLGLDHEVDLLRHCPGGPLHIWKQTFKVGTLGNLALHAIAKGYALSGPVVFQVASKEYPILAALNFGPQRSTDVLRKAQGAAPTP